MKTLRLRDWFQSALLIGTAMALPAVVMAQTTWSPSDSLGNNNWSDPGNWTNQLPSLNNPATLNGNPPDPTLPTDIGPIGQLTMTTLGDGVVSTLDLQAHILTVQSLNLLDGTVASTGGLGIVNTGSFILGGGTVDTNVQIAATGNTILLTGTIDGTFVNTGTVFVGGSALSVANYIQAAGSTTISDTDTFCDGCVAPASISIGQLTNSGGQFINNGILTVNAISNAATFMNTGTLTGTSFTQSGGSTQNTGAMSLTGQLAINAGTFSNAGVLAIGSLLNGGTFNNAAGGDLTAASVTNILGGIINNAGTVTDDLTNAGTVNNTGIYNAIVAANSGTINNNAGATWTGSIQSNTGTINTIGTWNANQGPINNAGTFNYFGGNVVGVTTFANSGTLNFSGSQILANSPASLVSFVNNGTIAAQAPTDRLTINGTLSGSGTINTVVGDGNASVVTVQGTSSGTQNITVTNSGSSAPVFNSPQTVLALNGGGSLTVGNKGLVPQISNGLFNNFLIQNGAGSNAFLQTAFNDGPVSGVATGLSSAINVLATGFFPNVSAIVSRPDNPEPNQIGGGPFARVIFGGSRTNLGSSASAFGQSTTSFTNGTTNYSGFQAGFDVGVYNIESSGWNVNLGLFGGVANAGTSATTASPTPVGASLTSTTQLSLSVPFVALYTFVSKESFTAEVNVRRDYYSGSILSFTSDTNGFLIAPNTPLSGSGWSLNANIANRFNLNDWLYVEPLVSLNWGNYTFDSINFNSALGLGSSSINPGTIEILLGRAGVNAGSTFLATDNLALAPFIHGSIWHDFAGQNTASAQTTGGNFAITADRIGTFGQVGGGIQFKILDIALLGFARGDFLFGDNITGGSFNIGLKKQF